MASEFRRYRLASRLFDCFGATAAPMRFMALIDAQRAALAEDALDWAFLRTRALDPERLARIAHDAAQDGEDGEMRVFLAFLQRLMRSADPADAAAFLPEQAPLGRSGTASPSTDAQGSAHAREETLAPWPGVHVVRTRTDTADGAGALPAEGHEQLIVEDMLGVLLGHPGKAVRLETRVGAFSLAGAGVPRHAAVYAVDEALGRTLVEAVQPLLQAGADYVRLVRFSRGARAPERGRVCQALCAAVHETLREFQKMVVGLEARAARGGVGLQQVLFHVAPQARGLRALSDAVDAVESAGLRGGAILAALETAAASHAGDRGLRAQLDALAGACARPFVEMLRAWLADGAVDDAHGEFLVRPRLASDGPAPDGASLAAAYVPVAANVPASLGGALLPRIVLAGAYRAALRAISADAHSADGPGAQSGAASLGDRQQTGASVPASMYGPSLNCASAGASQPLPLAGQMCSGPCVLGVGAPHPPPFAGQAPSGNSSAPSGAFAAGHFGAQAPLGSAGGASGSQAETLGETSRGPGVLSLQPLREQIREMGGAPALEYSAGAVAAAADAALRAASREMVAALCAGGRLEGALRTCRRVFLGECADALSSFLDAARAELERPAGSVGVERLRALWESAVRPAGEDARLELELAELPLAEQLFRIAGRPEGAPAAAAPVRVVDVLSARLRVSLPESLVLTPDALTKYALLFRLQLMLAFAARRLAAALPARGAWADASRDALLARRRMLALVSGVQQYVAHDVLEPAWRRMLDALAGAASLEDVLAAHGAFLDTALRQTMLSNARLVHMLAHMLAAAGALADAGPSAAPAAHAAFDAGARAFLDALHFASARDYDYHLGTLHARLELGAPPALALSAGGLVHG